MEPPDWHRGFGPAVQGPGNGGSPRPSVGRTLREGGPLPSGIPAPSRKGGGSRPASAVSGPSTDMGARVCPRRPPHDWSVPFDGDSPVSAGLESTPALGDFGSGRRHVAIRVVFCPGYPPPRWRKPQRPWRVRSLAGSRGVRGVAQAARHV